VNENVRQALEIDHHSTAWQRTIDITTIGARTGRARRIEIWFYRVDGQVYLSGLPGRQSWPFNLRTNPGFTFHLKHGVHADLQAVATEVSDGAERRRVFADFVADFNQPHDPARIGRRTSIDEWVDGGSPLFAVEFD
jgi:F420H(2)-dependent quinone reductase